MSYRSSQDYARGNRPKHDQARPMSWVAIKTRSPKRSNNKHSYSPWSGTMAGSWETVRGFQQIVAVRIEPPELSHCLDPAGRASSLDEDDQVDRFRDQPARDGRDRFLNQLLDPIERGSG